MLILTPVTKGIIMNQRVIIISGPSLFQDKSLYNGLIINNTVLNNNNNFKLESILKEKTVHCIVVEINNDDPFEIENIKNIKKKFPDINMILIEEDRTRDNIARAFQMGASDVFSKPYKLELLLERINAMMKYGINSKLR